MDKMIKQLLKEAHDHGFSIAKSNLDWSIEKSYAEFMKQNNFPLVSEDELRDQIAQKAIQLQKEGHSLRSIASILAYVHPQSVKNLIYWYEKRQAKKAKP